MKIDRRKFLFCGDSLVDENVIKNTGLMWNCENHWTAMLSKILEAPYINTAMCGDTIANIGQNVESRILQYNPSIVFLDGGANDCGTGTSASVTQENMRNVIQMLINNGKQVALLLFPVNTQSWSAYSPASDFITLPTKYQELADEFIAKYPDKFCFLNLEGKRGMGTTGNSSNSIPQENRIDGLHFNPSGHKTITENILFMLAEIDDSINANAGVQCARVLRY